MIFDCFIFQQVYLPLQKFFQCRFEIKIIVSIVIKINIGKINQKINITRLFKAISQYRPENKQLRHLMPTAQVPYLIQVLFN